MPMRPPAAPMFAILMLKEHAPRSTRTIFPASEPGANGSQPSRLPPAPSPYCTGASITEVSGADHGCQTAGKLPAMVAGETICMSGRNALGTAVCATDSALGAAAGVPLAYGLSLLLPADATVSTPALVAFSTAVERSSSNGWP